ncbi:MAG: hypothetical protein Q8S58_01335 [Bosea sp. (in: a-proteobacteria)]|uniref:hypothetical protein n=1 Tax=Bosea sp. (in: a-proteobacteria) TaxID=1871050 RepID=UPI0027355776|nr:hypothetical protein [Bosea sp. (in: a-proteobacteria)]MDP3255003.1 hypothetical protein [Bosea sp. (in: a-proteobacteria)]MDP3317746.1 hypothetical protein [Bosea sp. (in: a-proteobacteria)]
MRLRRVERGLAAQKSGIAEPFVAFAVQKRHIAGARAALPGGPHIEPAGSAVYADSNLVGISPDSCCIG